jgi:hypothetical protein
MELTNSKRALLSASYVAIQLTESEQKRAEAQSGRGLEKVNFLRQIGFTVESLNPAFDALMAREGANAAALRLAKPPLVEIVRALSAGPIRHTNLSLTAKAGAVSAAVLTDLAGIKASQDDNPMLALQAKFFAERIKTAPVGRLHLERLEMYPAGVQRGELMFTVPLSPMETTTISHKEWSTSSQEYEQIVEDYFESYSERGVAEKSDASMSTENEAKHASAFNFSSSVSGGFGPVSTTVSVGLQQTSDNRDAVKSSLQRSREVTEKASARSRQQHKISMKLESTRGTEDLSFKTVTNPSPTAVMRVDYYRMMRKWRTDLLRYGLRLTFDVAIPNPGARLWALYRRLRDLDRQIAEPFVFTLDPQALTDGSWADTAASFGATIDAPPAPVVPLSITKTLTATGGGNDTFVFTPPANYILDLSVKGDALWHGPGANLPVMFPPNTSVRTPPAQTTLPGGGAIEFDGTAYGNGAQASFPVIFSNATILLTVNMGAHRDPALMDAWRMKAWADIRTATFAAYQEAVARKQAERDQLWISLSGKDTLTLRRLEREELIRQTLHWIIGIEFDPTPSSVGSVVEKLVTLEENQLPDSDPGADAARRLTPDEWSSAAGFGDFVKYFQQAFEWENLLYFLYPYFWGSDDIAREKMLFEHPDPNHRDFLRAGFARVVVPVRPGFEESFTQLLDGTLPTAGTPYLTIAEEVAAFARTNYAGIPPANPEKHARPLLYPEQRTTWDTMQNVVRLLEAYWATNSTYPADLSGLAGAPFRDAWGRDLVYACPGSGNDYDLFSYGADGQPGGEDVNADISAGAFASLVASWFEYTPTSGIDIELNTAPAVIA